MTHAIDTVTSIIVALFGLVMEAIGVADGALAASMTSAGLPVNLQIIVLIVVAVLLVIFAIRVLGRVFGALLIVLLVLLIMNRLEPGIGLTHSVLPAGQQSTGQQL